MVAQVLIEIRLEKFRKSLALKYIERSVNHSKSLAVNKAAFYHVRLNLLTSWPIKSQVTGPVSLDELHSTNYSLTCIVTLVTETQQQSI